MLNIGLFFVYIGLAIDYIVFQIVPFIYCLSALGKDNRKEMSFHDWLFEPVIAIMLIIPVVGAIIGLIFQPEDDKWLLRFAWIGNCILMIGTIIITATI